MTVEEIELAINSIRLVLEHTEKVYYPEQFKTHEECLHEVMDIVRKCEETYNKGYADGVKSVNICLHCGEYIGEEE